MVVEQRLRTWMDINKHVWFGTWRVSNLGHHQGKKLGLFACEQLAAIFGCYKEQT